LKNGRKIKETCIAGKESAPMTTIA
jgi:hypothetical protein